MFEEDTTQLDVFRGTGVVELVEGVLSDGRDGLCATLGVTGSGKVSRSCFLGSRRWIIRAERIGGDRIGYTRQAKGRRSG